MNPYSELSEDDSIAFMQLESEFRAAFEDAMQLGSWDYHAPDYMNKVLAAAKEFGIDALAAYDLPYGRRLDYDLFSTFQRDVDHVIVRLRIGHSRRIGKTRVGLSSDQKTKLLGYTSKMRLEVEKSSASQSKKDAIINILSSLDAEIGKDRSNYEKFADLARSLAGLSKYVAKEGAEPWWKWFKLAAGVVDEAKDQEPALPAPADIKRIEPPRKELPKPSPEPHQASADDEIPF